MNNTNFRAEVSKAKSAEQALCDAGRAFWEKPAIIAVLSLLLSAFDGITIFPVYEALFNSSPVLLWASVLITASMLQFIPIMLARLYSYNKYGMPERDKKRMIFLIVIFIVLYLSVCALRFTNMDVMFVELSDILSKTNGAGTPAASTQTAVASEKHTATPGQICVVLLQCVANLSSSLVCFELACCDNPITTRIKALRRYLLDRYEERARIEAESAELRQFDAPLHIDHLHRKHLASRDKSSAINEDLHNQSLLRLAIRLGTPDQLTEIIDSMGEIPSYSYSFEKSPSDAANTPRSASEESFRSYDRTGHHSSYTSGSYASATADNSYAAPTPPPAAPVVQPETSSMEPEPEAIYPVSVDNPA